MPEPSAEDFKAFVSSEQPAAPPPAPTPAPVAGDEADPSPDGFKQFLQTDQAATPADKLGPALKSSASIPPAAAAQAIGLNRATGLPEDFILRNPEAVDQHAKNLAKDPAAFARQYPVTADFMGDTPTHASVVGSDLDSVTKYEDQFSDHKLLGKVSNALASTSETLNNLLLKSPAAGVMGLVHQAAEIPAAINTIRQAGGSDLPPELESQYQKMLVENPVAAFAAEKQKALGNADLDGDTLNLVKGGHYMRAGLHLANQLTNMAPMMASMAFGGQAAAAATALGSMGEEAAEGNKTGVSPQAFAGDLLGKGAVMMGANEVTLGLMKSFGASMAKVAGKEASKQALKGFWAAMTHNMATDASSFALMKAGDDFIDYASGVNPDALKGEGHKMINEALTGALMGAVVGAPRAAAEAGEKAAAEAPTGDQAPKAEPVPGLTDFAGQPIFAQKLSAVRQAEADLELYTGLGKTAEQSKLKALSPEAHGEITDKMAEHLSPSLNVEGAEQYFQSQGIEPVRAFSDLGLAEKYEEAKHLGLPEIGFKMGDWLNKVAGTPHYEGLKDHVKFDDRPGSMTPAQAVDFKKSMDDLASGPQAQENSTDGLKNKVFEETYKQLIKFYPDSIAKALAQRHAKIYEHIGGGALVGKRLTPEELQDRFPVQVGGTSRRVAKNKAEITESKPLSFDFGANAEVAKAQAAMLEPPEEHTDLSPEELHEIQADRTRQALVENGGITPLLNAIRREGKLSWASVQGSNRAGELRELNHLRIFDKEGMEPDLMAARLHEMGDLPEADMDKMIDQIQDEAKKLTDAKTKNGENWVKGVQTASKLHQFPSEFERAEGQKAEDYLNSKWNDYLTPGERIHQYYRDDVHGALNENGFMHLKPDPAKPMVAFFNVPKKGANDKMGHDAGDKVLRTVAQAALTVDPEAAVVKGNLALRVRDEAHAQELARAINAAMPERLELFDKDGNSKVYNGKAFKVDGALGPNFKEAAEAWKPIQDRLRAEGKEAPRGELPLEHREVPGEESEEAGRAGLAQVSPEMIEKLKGQPNEDVYNKAWFNPENGLPNKAGFNQLPKKAHFGVWDVDKMGEYNRLLGEKGGDEVIKRVGIMAKAFWDMHREAGLTDDLANVSGDEFYQNIDDPEKGKKFALDFRNFMSQNKFSIKLDNGKEIIIPGVGISFGIGENHDAAEKGLKADKNRSGAATGDSIAAGIREENQGRGGDAGREHDADGVLQPRGEDLRPKLDRAAAIRGYQESHGGGGDIAERGEHGPVSAAEQGRLPEFSDVTETLNQIRDQGQRPVAPAFYSKLQKTIESKLGNAATVDQVHGLLKDLPADERKWSGIDDFLKDKEKVSKPELLEFLRSNQLQIHEVVKGDSKSQDELFDSLVADEADKHRQEFGEEPDLEELRNTLAQEIEDGVRKEPGNTKFGQYVLPGGENYHEVLLTAPGIGDSNKLDEISNKMFGMPYKDLTEENSSGDSEAAAKRVAVKRKLRQEGGHVVEYRAGHFDEMNVLSHVRTTDRTTVDGKKALMLEEVQSDWHQKGRKEGYKEKTIPYDFDKGVFGQSENQYFVTMPDGKKIAVGKGVVENEVAAEHYLRNHIKTLNTEKEADQAYRVPDAPFKKTWHEFALKRMLREAAEKGYDKLAWTTGDQQAARYDLSKQVDKIRIRKRTDGTFSVAVNKKGESTLTPIKEVVTAQELPELIGKDLAEKAAIQESGPVVSYEGGDLKVGGEGMKGFYDKIIPDYLNKFGKKFGAKVEDTELPQVGKVHSIDITPAMRKTALEEGFPMFQGRDHFGEGENPTGASINLNRNDEGDFAGSKINIPPNANVSQWLHESFHHYLEMMKELAKDPNASPQLHQDLQALRDWERKDFLDDPEGRTKRYASQVLAMGEGKDASPAQAAEAKKLKDFAGSDPRKLAFALKDFEETGQAPAGMADIFTKLRDRMLHEAGAEGYENYSLEGNAPNADLKGAFSRIRAWMLAWYKKGKAYFERDLNGEVRDFFDRLVAGQDAIEDAKSDQGFHAYFPKPEALGLGPAETQEYAALIEKTNQEAQDKMALAAIRRMKREQSTEYKEGLEENRQAAAEIAGGIPHVRARSILETGKMPDGSEPPAGLKDLKLDRAAVEAEYPEKAKELGAQLDQLTGANGRHPDEAAGLLGFSSGDELLHWMADPSSDPKSWIERMAMYRQGLADSRRPDEDLAEMAMDAIHNEDASKVIEYELKLLHGNKLAALKLGAMVAQPVPDLETIKAQAREAIETKINAGQLVGGKANQYAKASAEAGKKAVTAILASDVKGARQAKLKQLMNNELYRGASEAKKEIEKIVATMAKFKTAATRDRIGKAGTGEAAGLGYLPQIDAIMERFGFKRPAPPLADGEQATPGRRTLLGWVDAMQEKLGYPITFDPIVMDEGVSKSWRDLSFEEIKGVRDAVKQIAHMAGAANRLLKNEAFADLESARVGIKEALQKNFDLTAKKPDFAPGLKAKLIETGQGVAAAHTKPEFLFNYMDGNKAQGLVWKTFMDPMNKAEENEKARNHATAQALDKVFEAYTPKERAEWHTKKIYVPEIDNSLTKANLLALGLNQGNQYNRDAVMQGWQWSPEQVTAALNHLDKRDWDTIQNVWRHLDSYWPDIAEQEQAIKGVVPARVESAAVQTKFGTYEGGYYPIVFDGKYSWRQAQLNEKANMKDLLGGDWAGAQTRHGHTVERKNTGGKPILLEMSGLTNHIACVNHDLAYRQTIMDLNKLSNDYDVHDAIEGAVGRQMASQLNPWLKAVAGDRGTGLGGMMEGILNGLRSNVTTAQLGLHLSTALKHTGNLVSAMNELGPQYWAKGLRDAWARPDQIGKNWEFIASRSPMMRDRAEDFDRDVKDTGRRLSISNGGGIKSGQLMPPAVTKFMMSYLSHTDKFTSMPMWMGAYRKAMEGGHPNVTAGDEHGAVSYADQVVRDYKGAGATKDLARIQTGTGLGKLFTMFYSQLAVQFNQYQKIAHQASFNSREGMGVTENAARTLGAYALQIFPAVAVMGMIGHGPNTDDEDSLPEKAWKMTKWGALTALDDVAGSVIGLRDLAHGMIQHWETGRKEDFQASPAFGSAQDLMHTVTSDFSDTRAMGNLTGSLTGLPTAEAFKAGQRFYDWYTGDNVPTSTAKGVYQALVSGEPRE